MRYRYWCLILAALLFASLACKAAQGDWGAPANSDLPPAVTHVAATSAAATIAAMDLPSAQPTALPPGTPTASIIVGSGAATPSIPAPTSEITAASPFNPTLPPTVDVPPTFTVIPSPTLPPTQPVTPSADELDKQTQVFEELWNVINDHYLYADFNGLDWQAVRQDYASRIEAGISMADFYLAMHQMVRGLGDEHSTFFDPEQAAAQDAEYAGQYDYVGIGILSGVVEESKRLVVLLVFPDSPAEQAGIRMHDSIISADGQPLVDEQGARLNLLRGPEGTSVQIEVQTPGQAPRVLSITRQRVNSTLPVPFQVLSSPDGKRIGYIFVPTFNDSTVGVSIGQALRDMTAEAPLDGVIIDNRQNGGGASTVLQETMGYFIDGVAGYFVEQDNRYPLEVEGQDINGSQELPLVVMVGERTASFGEVFAGALRDMNRAHLIGEQTDGNVEILNIFNFSDGSRAWIATSTFQPLNQPDANWEATGIMPDESVPSAWHEVTVETDPAVLAALEYFDLP